jgi:hypothetical protein
MTLPSEELRSINLAHEFLREIATGPRMPTKVLRERAFRCLHHWPFECNLDEMYAPRIAEKEPWTK